MINGKFVLAVIPARGGSKGVPRKNLRIVNDRSLLAATIESAKYSKYIDMVVVSSEDEEIIAEARRAGAEIPFIRPVELAQDDTPGIDPILHALDHLPQFDYVIVLQVTSPLRTTEDIDRCIKYCNNQNASACVSVVEAETHPFWMFRINDTSKLEAIFSGDIPARRQDLPAVYAVNGAIYIAKTDWLLKNKKFITDETIAYIMPRERSLDLDTEFDFKILDAYLKIQDSSLIG